MPASKHYDGPIPYVQGTDQPLDYLDGAPHPGNYWGGGKPNGSTYSQRVGKADIEWRENREFFKVLRLTGIFKRRSAVSIQWEDAYNPDVVYPMFLKDFESMILARGVGAGGFTSGQFVFCKRGANYGIQYVRR